MRWRLGRRGGTHQTIQASTEQVHGTHLHGGHLGHVDRGAQVQIQEVTQEVALRGDDLWLVDWGSRTGTHWALPCVNAVRGWGWAHV